MPLEYVEGDLLECHATHGAQVILQQTNCVTVNAHGLSEAIARRFPYANVYAARGAVALGRNRAARYDRPGAVVCCVLTLFPTATEAGTQQLAGPIVACLMAQRLPGRSTGRHAAAYDVDPATDTAPARVRFFRVCLVRLAELVRRERWTCIAIPFQIGCGLAGGDWSKYRQLLDAWVDESLTPLGCRALLVVRTAELRLLTEEERERL